MVAEQNRAGRYVEQPADYRAYIPVSLPPSPALRFDTELVELLSTAATALGRLDGIAITLPNPSLFVAMYVRREAVLSSQIEGTQSTLDDVLTFEINPKADHIPKDVEEVVNYVAAMTYGLQRLAELPLSLRLLKEIHGRLLQGVRGGEKSPGEFRTSQNWIGNVGPRGLRDATYVPPPPAVMTEALGDFEKFLHADHGLPPLIVAGLAHAQFETIHPFLDGNGRVGRLLVTFLLVHAGELQRPLLYLSHFLKQNRAEYYDRLTAVRFNGDWEGWLKFFLRGVRDVAAEAALTANKIVELREQARKQLQSESANATGLILLDRLFMRPITNVKSVADDLRVSFASANNLVANFCDEGLLTEITGGKRNRMFRFDQYLKLFSDVAPQIPDVDLQETHYAPGGRALS